MTKDQQITDTLEQNFMPYAMSVIVSRAIPEIDGFKPSHRKLLFTMYKMGLLNGARTKSANIVGQTMKLNPHGDAAIYETLVRLTTGNDALLHPFIDSKGNFGKQYSRDMAYAASRYTEAKLSAVCAEIFDGIDKNAIDFTDNYDGTMKEPLLLPTKFPNVLVNPNQGIAVGMATNICGFNLREIADTTIALLKNPSADITKTLPAPDFSTGGCVYANKAELMSIYETGRGNIKLQAVYNYDKANGCIDITEIPYTTTTEAIIEKVVDLVKNGKIKEINDIRDETDLNGLKITIDLKRGADADKLMARLFKLTPLMDTFGCNFNILVNGEPKTLGVKDILFEWIQFRMECIRRTLTFDIDKMCKTLHLLQGLEKILLDIDKAIAIIRGTELEQDVVPNLMEGFSIDDEQAEYIADIRLRNINKQYILKRIQEIESLLDNIANLRAILSDNEKIKKEIIKELSDIAKKHGTPRRTKIIDKLPEVIEELPEVENYNVKLFVTKEGYIKKIPLTSLRGNFEQKFKDNDELLSQYEVDNTVDILVFTDKATVYKLSASELDDSKASNLGDYLPSLLSFADGENFFDVAVTSDYSGMLIFCYKNGKVAKVPLSAYETKTRRKKLMNAYCDASEMVALFQTVDEIDIMLRTSAGKALVLNTSLLSLKATRDTQGVIVIALTGTKHITAATIAPEGSGKYVTQKIPAAGKTYNEDQIKLTIEN